MSSQMQANFLNHILNFFAPKEKDEGNASNADVPSAPSAPDLPVLVGMLLSSGFQVKYSDNGERGGSSDGCRAIIICKRSGTRVVMQGEGPCTCPSEETLKKHLHPSSAGQAPSRAPSPTPSAVGQLEDPLNISMTSTVDDNAPAPPRLNRQRTWSRDEDSNNCATQNAGSPANRRLSAPPGSISSPWATLQGDDLNVMAAADLLQEAMSLLTGVKKLSLRNTPVGPSRRQSAASRRMSTDTFAQPLRPLSRTSSVSSGLGSARSTSSHSDTPRPPHPTDRPTAGTGKRGPETPASVLGSVGTGAASVGLRRTISVCAGTTATALQAKARPTPTSLPIRTKSDSSRKGPPEASTGTRSVVTKMTSLLKPPSTTTKTFTRPSIRAGIKTNASLVAKPTQPKTDSKSPEVESSTL